MRVSIGNVWDSTTAVLAGRAGLLFPVALLGFFLPAAVQAAVSSYAGPSTGVAALTMLVALASLVATLWGQLTVLGVASNPDMTRAAASQAAVRRLGPALLVLLVIVAVAVIAALPIVVALIVGGFDLEAAIAHAGSSGAPALTPGAALFCVLWFLLLLGLAFWLGARLFLWSPVVLHERRGVGALGRSFQLTRGLTAKLIGVALLFGVVYLVAASAAQFVVGIVFRLLLGPANIATSTFLAGLAGAAVGAVFSVVVATFTARLYAAVAAPVAAIEA